MPNPAILFGILVLGMLGSACQSAPPPTTLSEHAFTMRGVPIPQDVRRVAVFYPSEPEWTHAYLTLEHAVFQLKETRPELMVLSRRDVRPVEGELFLHLSGRVSDGTAVRVGHLLGADSIVLFQIEGPGWRERLLARMYGSMPPILVMSKIVRVETGEILYHDLVSSQVVPGAAGWEDFDNDYELRPVLRSALGKGLETAIARLHWAFR